MSPARLQRVLGLLFVLFLGGDRHTSAVRISSEDLLSSLRDRMMPGLIREELNAQQSDTNNAQNSNVEFVSDLSMNKVAEKGDHWMGFYNEAKPRMNTVSSTLDRPVIHTSLDPEIFRKGENVAESKPTMTLPLKNPVHMTSSLPRAAASYYGKNKDAHAFVSADKYGVSSEAEIRGSRNKL
eukprot:jgi/Bigna1/70683/fgenesh1_pg.12_\